MKHSSSFESQQMKGSFGQLLEIWKHIDRRRRTQLGLLFVVMLLNGAAEIVSLSSIIPF